MAIRPFDWRDIPTLHRYRQRSVYLDSALVLTRGPMLVPGALLSYLAPGMGILTSVVNGCEDSEHTLIGQALHMVGAQYARMTFLAPEEALLSTSLPSLLDHLAVQAGDRGAFRLLAEVDEHSPAFEALRSDSFAIYSRQRIWQLSGIPSSNSHDETPADSKQDANWRPASSRDAIAIRSLYNNLVPGLVQQVEPLPMQNPRGLVYRRGEDLLAFVELKYGHKGIWVQPFVHPDAEEVAGQIGEMLQKLPNRRSRPVYFCVRSYQSWLEPTIEDLGAEAGPRQAVMVKHLTVLQKAARMFALPALEGGHPEISAPIARSESK